MEIPSAYALLLQRANKCTDQSALERACSFLKRVQNGSLWDDRSQWRNGFICTSLLQVLGLHQIDLTLRETISAAFLNSQRADGSWVDPEAQSKNDASPTAMAVLVLAQLDRTVHDVAINDAVAWLLANQGPEGAWVSDSSALDDIVADSALVVRALRESGREDTNPAILSATRFLNSFVTEDFFASDRCRPVNAFALSWLLDNASLFKTPRVARHYLSRLSSPQNGLSIMELAQTLTLCVRMGISPYEPVVQSSLGRLLLMQRPDGSWPGQEERNPAYVTSHMLHCLPLVDFRVNLALTSIDLTKYQQGLEDQLIGEVECVREEAEKKFSTCQYDKAVLEERVRSLESERDMFQRKYLLHVETHEDQIRATGRLGAVEEEYQRCREKLDHEQKEVSRWQTYFWFVFAATVSIVTGFVVNLFTSHL